jgi:hypothetical protein
MYLQLYNVLLLAVTVEYIQKMTLDIALSSQLFPLLLLPHR